MSAISTDSVGPKHNSTVRVVGLVSTNASMMSPAIISGNLVSCSMYAGTINTCTIIGSSHATTTTQYAVEGLHKGDPGVMSTDVFCNVTYAIVGPFAHISFSGLVDAAGDSYSDTTRARSFRLIIHGFGPATILPSALGAYYSVPAFDAADVFNATMSITDTGDIYISGFNPNDNIFWYPTSIVLYTGSG